MSSFAPRQLNGAHRRLCTLPLRERRKYANRRIGHGDHLGIDAQLHAARLHTQPVPCVVVRGKRLHVPNRGDETGARGHSVNGVTMMTVVAASRVRLPTQRARAMTRRKSDGHLSSASSSPTAHGFDPGTSGVAV